MSDRPTVTAALFPGQGVSLAGSRQIVDAACPQAFADCCELLGGDPFDRASESTRFAQPAIFLASIAAWIVLDGDAPSAFAGHSLGELSALTAAGAVCLADAVSLVVSRGALMAEAADRQGDGGMIALLKGTIDDARALCHEHGVEIANDNAPGQTVLSGRQEELGAVAAAARARGLSAIRLDVAGAFHSRTMQSACEPFRRALAAVRFSEPRAVVISSTTAEPFRDVRAELSRALVRPVRWRETMTALRRAGTTRFLDMGPDTVLARLAERNVSDAEVFAAVDLHGVEEPRGISA